MAVTTHLREVRKSKGLTQKEVADALLISKVNIPGSGYHQSAIGYRQTGL